LGGNAEAGTGGGAGGAPVEPAFMLGADISSMQEAVDAGTSYVDTDGVSKGLLELLRGHGFNYVRLRTFVEPTALYGYANPTGEDQFRKSESYCDTAHTLELAQQVKQAGMGFLLDLHYSDNWADPGKQVIPEAWRGASSIEELAARVETYTHEVVSALIAGGARPDMVQIGNEITPGLLIHVPAANPEPDQWGNIDKVTNAVNGSAADFDNVARLLKAGVAGVKATDPSIRIMLHLENTESFPAVRDWVDGVRSRGVEIDVLGLSCYPAFQGEPAIWQDTFEQLAKSVTDVSFVIAEYNPEATLANRIMADLPARRGLGTFFWEPTQGGAWGPSLFTFVNGVAHANADAFAEFDSLKASLGL
jgi:arabinogalactan endo-1,4-beta-galactosidase